MRTSTAGNGSTSGKFDALMFLALLHFGVSAWLRDLAGRITGRRLLQPALYALGFVLIVWALSFPLTVYIDHVRERQYGLPTQTLGGWFGDELKGVAISLVTVPIAAIVLYAVLRRAGRTWWLWGSLVTIAFIAAIFAIGPVYIALLFNTYTPLGLIRNPETMRLPVCVTPRSGQAAPGSGRSRG